MLFLSDSYVLSPATAGATPALETVVAPVTASPSEISSQTIRGGAYFAARYGLGAFVSLGNMLVMTRWIGPHNYGLFVTAVGLAGFLSTLARAGLDTSLVRRESAPDTRIYNIASTLILGISAGLMLTGAALAPLLIHWFGSREFLWPYLALLFTIPLTGLSGVPLAKLERRLDFGSVAGIEVAGQALGLVTAAVLAWSGLGV